MKQNPETFFKGPDIRLYLDDLREMPLHFTHMVRRAVDAIEIIRSGRVTEVSLDHDLGVWDHDDKHNGYMVACAIEEMAKFGDIPRLKWKVHSDNPPGAKKMIAALTKADFHWEDHEREEREERENE